MIRLNFCGLLFLAMVAVVATSMTAPASPAALPSTGGSTSRMTSGSTASASRPIRPVSWFWASAAASAGGVDFWPVVAGVRCLISAGLSVDSSDGGDQWWQSFEVD